MLVPQGGSQKTQEEGTSPHITNHHKLEPLETSEPNSKTELPQYARTVPTASHRQRWKKLPPTSLQVKVDIDPLGGSSQLISG